MLPGRVLNLHCTEVQYGERNKEYVYTYVSIAKHNAKWFSIFQVNDPQTSFFQIALNLNQHESIFDKFECELKM